MYINILRTFSDIGPLGILSLCPPYWISKWPPFEITFAIICGSNVAIDLILVSKCMFFGSRNPMLTICIAFFYQWAATLDLKMAALHYMAASRSTFVVILGSNDMILVVMVVVVVVVVVVAVVEKPSPSKDSLKDVKNNNNNNKQICIAL